LIYNFETLDSLLGCGVDFAVNYYKEKNEIFPTIVGYTSKNDSKIILSSSLSDSLCKESFLETTKLVFLGYDVDKYFFIFEAFVEANKSNGTTVKYDRIVVLAVNRTGNKMATYNILQNKSLEFVGIEENAFGSFSNLLPVKKLSKIKRSKVLDLLKTKNIEFKVY
jgi:hypothetical protein